MSAPYRPFAPRGRFYLVDTRDGGDGWTLADDLDGSCVSFDTKAAADDAARFARRYVKRHGDIDLQSFPFQMDQPLTYCDDDPFGPARESRTWAILDGQVVNRPAA